MNKLDRSTEIEIKEGTFSMNHIKVLRTDISPIGNSGAFSLFVEITSEKNRLGLDLAVKTNLIDSEGKIIGVHKAIINCEGFAGYDTIEFRVLSETGGRTEKFCVYATGDGPSY